MSAGYLVFITQRYSILKGNLVCANAETVYCLELIDHVVLDRCGELLHFLWVFQILCLSPGSVPWHLKTFLAQFGTLAVSRNNPSSTLPFCTAHLVLNTLYFVSELTACTGLMSTTRSPALWSSETIPGTHLAQKLTRFVLHRKCSTAICGMCGLKKSYTMYLCNFSPVIWNAFHIFPLKCKHIFLNSVQSMCCWLVGGM